MKRFADGVRSGATALLTPAALALAILGGAAAGSDVRAQTSPTAAQPETPSPQHAGAAQGAGSSVISPGDVVVAGFSGVKQKQGPQAVGASPLDNFFIDLDGSSAQAFRLDPNAAPHGQLINSPVLLQIKARDVGQVFGVALDDAPSPNIYLTATSAYGLQIVVDEGVSQKRVTKGQAGAHFMAGQFGENGGPGGVWKVDGVTGVVSVFATTRGNQGPGLGDIAYDAANGLFYVSDFETGLIHRIDANGRVLDAFDHGVNGRPGAGLPVVADDSAGMNITYPTFDSENPETWGLTQPERRIWGLAVHGGRLYYAVWSGPQVWSVGVGRNGFANDARLEFQVAGGEPTPIAHMTFDRSGTLYLSQRGGLESSYDYTVFARGRISKTLRYRQLGGKWSREDYSIGFPPRQQNASGGVTLGYGYDSRGKLDKNRCDATLWTTGDALRNDPARSSELTPGGPPVVHGLQGNDVSWVRPADAPARSFFVDYDGVYGDPRAEGHVGSAAIFQTCTGKNEPAPQQHASEDVPLSDSPDCPGCGEPDRNACAPGDPKCGEPPCDPNDPYCSRKPCVVGDPYCRQRNLKISKRPLSACHKTPTGFVCGYRIAVTNTGPNDYDGLIRVRDIVPPGAQLLASGGPAPCNLVSGLCATPAPVHLAPNDSFSFVVRLKVSPTAARRLRCHVHNRARIVYAPSGSNANTNADDDEASTTAIISSYDCEKEKTNLKIEKRAEQCVRAGSSFTCVYDLRFVNTGPGDYRGPIAFTDTIPSGASATVVSPAFTCTGGGPVYNCTSNEGVSVSPGGSVGALVKVVTPAAMTKALRCRVPNVAHINQPAGGSDQNTDPSDDTAMATATIPAANCTPERSNLKMEKRATTCAKSGTGYTCLFEARYTNTGPGAHQGVVSFTDSLPAGASATFLSPDFTCVGGPVYTCTSNGAVTLAPGASGGLLVNAAVPLDVAKAQDCQILNEAKIVLAPGGSEQNTETADDTASATALAPPPGCTPQTPPEKKSCTPGLEFNPETNRCESALGPACPADTEWNPESRSCEPAGARGAGGGAACEPGTSGTPPHCCPEGQQWDGERCAKGAPKEERCPEGSMGTWPHCTPAGQSCPPGWNWDGQRCAQVGSGDADEGSKCPPGFEKVGGQCVKPQPSGALPTENSGVKAGAASQTQDGGEGGESATPQTERPQHNKTISMRERVQQSRSGRAAGAPLTGQPEKRAPTRRVQQQKQRQHQQVRMMRKRTHTEPARRRPSRTGGGILPPFP